MIRSDCVCLYICKVSLREERNTKKEEKEEEEEAYVGKRLAEPSFKASTQVLQPAEECRHESAFIVLHRAAVGYQQQLSLSHRI